MTEKNFQLLAERSRIVVFISYATLCLLITLGVLVWPSCEREPNVTVWVIQLFFLLVFLPGLVKQNLRSLIWMCFVLLGFFLTSVSTAFVCSSLISQFEVITIVGLFSATILYVRWRAKALKQLSN